MEVTDAISQHTILIIMYTHTCTGTSTGTYKYTHNAYMCTDLPKYPPHMDDRFVLCMCHTYWSALHKGCGLDLSHYAVVSCPVPLLTCARTKEGLELFATFLGQHVLKCTSQSDHRILKYHVTIKERRRDDGMLILYHA